MYVKQVCVYCGAPTASVSHTRDCWLAEQLRISEMTWGNGSNFNRRLWIHTVSLLSQYNATMIHPTSSPVYASPNLLWSTCETFIFIMWLDQLLYIPYSICLCPNWLRCLQHCSSGVSETCAVRRSLLNILWSHRVSSIKFCNLVQKRKTVLSVHVAV